MADTGAITGATLKPMVINAQAMAANIEAKRVLMDVVMSKSFDVSLIRVDQAR
jgi:hypothetical protein